MAREELARFLRDRREGVRPGDVGLPAGSRRRTPGLRREEEQVVFMTADPGTRDARALSHLAAHAA